MNVTDIRGFFEQFEKAKTEHQIEDIDTWNMDESGYQVGVGRGQWVVIPVIEGMDYHQFTHIIGSLGDTEHLTVIESISAEAVTIDSFIIIKGAVIQL
jgi:hypothetical protein